MEQLYAFIIWKMQLWDRPWNHKKHDVFAGAVSNKNKNHWFFGYQRYQLCLVRDTHLSLSGPWWPWKSERDRTVPREVPRVMCLFCQGSANHVCLSMYLHCYSNITWLRIKLPLKLHRILPNDLCYFNKLSYKIIIGTGHLFFMDAFRQSICSVLWNQTLYS